MIAWTAFDGEVPCGYCNRRVSAGDPVARLTVSRALRCIDCARSPVDWPAVEAARSAIEQRRLGTVVPSSLATARPTPRALRPRPLKPLSALAGSLFDSKSAAAGDREE